MARRSKETNLDIRNLVIYHWKIGKSYREVENIVNKYFSAARNIWRFNLSEGMKMQLDVERKKF